MMSIARCLSFYQQTTFMDLVIEELARTQEIPIPLHHPRAKPTPLNPSHAISFGNSSAPTSPSPPLTPFFPAITPPSFPNPRCPTCTSVSTI